MPGDVQGKAWKFARPFHGPYRILELTLTNASVHLVDKPQNIPIFVSLDRVRRCPKEIPDGETWSGKRGAKKTKKTRRTQAPRPEARNSQEPEPEPESGPGSKPVPETRTSQEPRPWSTRL